MRTTSFQIMNCRTPCVNKFSASLDDHSDGETQLVLFFQVGARIQLECEEQGVERLRGKLLLRLPRRRCLLQRT